MAKREQSTFKDRKFKWGWSFTPGGKAPIRFEFRDNITIPFISIGDNPNEKYFPDS